MYAWSDMGYGTGYLLYVRLVVERTRAGLAAAREEGRIGGRRSKLTDEQWAQAGRLVAAGESRQRVALIYDVGISTLYKKFPATR